MCAFCYPHFMRKRSEVILRSIYTTCPCSAKFGDCLCQHATMSKIQETLISFIGRQRRTALQQSAIFDVWCNK